MPAKDAKNADDLSAWAMRTAHYFSINASAAPHRPAGHFSPYSDGEKDAFADDFANYFHCKECAKIAASPFSPSLYGEKVAAAG
ncbi:hypothetical protein NKH16_20865 [Mesorhizobium sp. M1307]|uniref:hypothetical protein n=1 Tax=unclassified Mesorhizobium TaxID=325217 RepID=UPI0033383018